MEDINTVQGLIYLLSCVVNHRVPKGFPTDLDIEELKKLSRFHSVTAMVSYALDSGKYLSKEFMSEEQVKFWASARIKAMQKSIMFDVERKAILKAFEEKGVWYMPLKGCILKHMYPDIGIREMADNDILFDRTYRNWLYDEMKERGYFAALFDKSNHDTYMKKPFYNFEFHVDLIDQEFGGVMGEYYHNVKERLLKDEDNDYGYHFSDEDFYIYMIAHALKHYKKAGTGIRILTDIYVYIQAKGQSMDWNYIVTELEKMGEAELELKLREIALELFDSEKTVEETYIKDDEKQAILEYMIGSGTYGTVKNSVQNDLVKLQQNEEAFSAGTKFKFMLKRLFPDAKHMGRYVPFCKKHKWAIPFCWIYRIVKSIIKRGSHIASEVRALKKL